jgi:hypothetical protein
MNWLDAAGNCIGPRHNLWVQSALGYMTSEAAVWAKPYMTQMLAGQMPHQEKPTPRVVLIAFDVYARLRCATLGSM